VSLWNFVKMLAIYHYFLRFVGKLFTGNNLHMKLSHIHRLFPTHRKRTRPWKWGYMA